MQKQIENKPKIIKNGKFIFLLKKLYLIFPKEINNNLIENENEIFTLTKLFEFKNLNKIPNSKENYILIKNIQNIFNYIYNLFNFKRKENYKIKLFTENFQNLENDNQLFFYKNNIIYAKINKLFNNFYVKIYENYKNQIKNNNNQINYNENLFDKNYYKFSNKKISNSFIIHNSKISYFKQKFNDKNKKFNNIQSIFQSKNTIKKINRSCSTIDLNYNIENNNNNNFNNIENNNNNNNENNNKNILINIKINKINNNNNFNNFFQKKKILSLKKYNNNNFFKTFNLSFQKSLNKIDSFSNKNKSTNFKNKNLTKIKKFLFPNFLFKEESKQNEKIINKIKEEYLILLLFLRKNLKNIDNIIKNENFINENLFLTDLNFNKKYEKFFPFKKCIKEFIFYSFINENCDELIKIIYNLNNENNIENKNNEINENFNKIKIKIIDLINNENLLNNFINKILITKEIKISKKFFEIFILCSNYFDEIQSKISHIFLIIFKIDNFVNFSNFCYYYLYFKNNNLLTNENKILFVKKFLNLFKIINFNKNTNEKLNTEIIKLLNIEIKLFNFLLYENNFVNDNEKLNIKIINIFNKIINYFNNFSFQ